MEDFKIVLNYFQENYFRTEKLEQFNLNKGMIIDSVVSCSLVGNYILNDIIGKNNKENKFIVYDKYKLTLLDLYNDVKEDYNKSIEKIINRLKIIYTNDDLKITLNDKKNEIIDKIQFYNLIKNIQYVSESYNIRDFFLFKNNKIDNLGDIEKKYKYYNNKMSKNLWDDMALVNRFGIKDLQILIYKFIEDNKTELLEKMKLENCIEDNFFEVFGLPKTIFKKIDFEVTLLNTEKYRNFKNKIDIEDIVLKNHENKFDYYDFRDLTSLYFGSKNKVIVFLALLLNKIKKGLGDIFLENINKLNIIIDPFNELSFGKTVNFVSRNEKIVYCTYDGTYMSVILILHEFAHFLSNLYLDNIYFINESSQFKNEIIAESFCLNILSIDNIEGYENELFNLKRIIKYNYIRGISYTFDQLLFSNLIRKSYDTKNLCKIYDEIMNKLSDLDDNGEYYVNSEYFKNNYIVNSKIYNTSETFISNLTIVIFSILHYDSIFSNIFSGKYIDKDYIINYFNENSIIDLAADAIIVLNNFDI